MLRRTLDAMLLTYLAANAHHLAVCACRWMDVRRARAAAQESMMCR